MLLFLGLLTRQPCNFKALLVAIASLVALNGLVSQVLWRLSTRMALIATIAISNDGVIACRHLL
jgi:hypothetical protein